MTGESHADTGPEVSDAGKVVPGDTRPDGTASAEQGQGLSP